MVPQTELNCMSITIWYADKKIYKLYTHISRYYRIHYRKNFIIYYNYIILSILDILYIPYTNSVFSLLQ